MSLNEAEDIHVAKKVKLETLAPTLDQLKDHSAEEAAPQAKLCKLKKTALRTMCNMQEKTLADAMVLTFEDEPEHVRCGALNVLQKLDPTTLAQCVPALLGCLNDASRDVRCRALKVLEMLDEETLKRHAPTLVDLLVEDADIEVKNFAAQVLVKLEPAALEQRFLFGMLEHKHDFVSDFAVKALCKLDKLDVRNWEDMLQHDLDHVRKNTMMVIDKHPETLAEDSATLAKHLVSCLGDEFSVDVHCGALKLLAKLDPTTLTQHVPAFICCLSNDSVFDVFKVLEKVEPAALAQHASALCYALNRYRYNSDDLIQVVGEVIRKLDSGMKQMKAKQARHADRKRQRTLNRAV